MSTTTGTGTPPPAIQLTPPPPRPPTPTTAPAPAPAPPAPAHTPTPHFLHNSASLSVLQNQPDFLSRPPPGDAFSPRPYTAGAASARTSFTRVDVDSRDVPRPLSPDMRGDGDGDGDGVEGSPHAEEERREEEEHEPAPPAAPQTTLTFLLISGRRRTMAFEPGTPVSRVKELVWNAWPSENLDERPPAPNYLRILYLGKIWQDEDTLAQLNLPTHTPPHPAPSTIVHLSIRPCPPAPPGDELKKGSGFKRRLLHRTSSEPIGEVVDLDADRGGCCCVVC